MEHKELISLWSKRNIQAVYAADKLKALNTVLEMIPQNASVGFSGSKTLEQIGIIESLKRRGNMVFDPYVAGISREESLKIRKDATSADFYLASANAVSRKGELVFFSAYSNRIEGVSSASGVIVVCGINKLTEDLDSALLRARNYAAPLNCRRLNWTAPCLKDNICRSDECNFPDYKRMCCQILIIEGEINPGRLRVLLVGEELGF